MKNPATKTTKELAMGLYEEAQRIHNLNNDAYFIAKNLEYLARCAEPDKEIPLEELYQLAERLHMENGSFYQPFLTEERLDAIRRLLERGIESPQKLSPEDTVEFLINCDTQAFAYIVEETVAYNLTLYEPEGFDQEGLEAFEKGLYIYKSELGKKPTLEQQISDAGARSSGTVKESTTQQPIR